MAGQRQGVHVGARTSHHRMGLVPVDVDQQTGMGSAREMGIPPIRAIVLPT